MGPRCPSTSLIKLGETMYFYSEIFHSIQGEGHYTGVPTAWLRFFLCNLQCDGFGQKDPTDKSTYDLPYKLIDVTEYNTMEELPVFERGCDSSYSWAKKFKSLAHKGTAAEICERVTDSMRNEYNSEGKFMIVKGNQITNQHMCFTGGEPLLKHGQKCVVEMMEYWREQGNLPRYITFETNGTQPLTESFKQWAREYIDVYGGEIFFSISPKLFSVSGESPSKAIQPEVISQYNALVGESGQLKFVINGTNQSWIELEQVIHDLRYHGVGFPVWIMPAGATVEGQKECDGDVASEALKRGYNVSARVHTYLWGNKIGV